MESFQIEKLYLSNGLKDFKLRNTEDLLKVHGINYQDVQGYSFIDDVNRSIYEKFIVKIFNAWGLESRATLIPKGIYYVEEIEYLVKENVEDQYFTVAGYLVNSIDREGKKKVLHDWIHEDYKDLEVTKKGPKNYLRFEYEHQGRSEWLHVTNEHTWY